MYKARSLAVRLLRRARFLGDTTTARRPLVADLIGTAVALIAAISAPPVLGGDSFLLHVLFLGCVYASMGHAWNVLAGYAGLLSFGNQAFVGLGGYGVAVCLFYWDLNVWGGLLVAAVVTMLFATLLAVTSSQWNPGPVRIGVSVSIAVWVIYEVLLAQFGSLDVFDHTFVRRVTISLLIFLAALPLLRLDGAYFAVSSWLIAAAVAAVFNEWTVVGAGGGFSIRGNLDLTALFYGAAGLLVATTLAVRAFEHSRFGLALTAIRDNQDAARAAGVNIERMKGYALVFSAGVTSFAGGLYFLNTGFITPTSAFDISWSAYFVFIAVSGGLGRLWGPVLGSILFVFVDQYVTDYVDRGLLVLGAASIVVVFALPDGIVGLWRRTMKRFGEGIQ